MISGPPKITPVASPQWVIDLNTLPPKRKPQATAIPDPPGFAATSSSGKVRPICDSPSSQPHPLSNFRRIANAQSQKIDPPPAPSAAETDDLFVKKAWEIAMATGKSLPMNAIMMYMSGNSLQIFSVMMTFMLFMNPIKALFSVGATFEKFENERTKGRLITVKLAYVALQLVTIALGIWKVNGMGLLPYVNPLPLWLLLLGSWEYRKAGRCFWGLGLTFVSIQDYEIRLASLGKRKNTYGAFRDSVQLLIGPLLLIVLL